MVLLAAARAVSEEGRTQSYWAELPACDGSIFLGCRGSLIGKLKVKLREQGRVFPCAMGTVTELQLKTEQGAISLSSSLIL